MWISCSPRSNSDCIVTLTWHGVRAVCSLAFSSYSAHQQNSGRMKWRRQREKERGKRREDRGRRERDTNWSFGGQISHSHPGRMDECLWWPLQVQAGRVSENKRNWFGPSGGESMCEGHVSAALLFCAGLWGLSKVWGVSNVTAEFSSETTVSCLLLHKKRKNFPSWTVRVGSGEIMTFRPIDYTLLWCSSSKYRM